MLPAAEAPAAMARQARDPETETAEARRCNLLSVVMLLDYFANQLS